MTTTRQRDHRPKTHPSEPPTRRVPMWLAAVTLAFVATGIAVSVWLLSGPGADSATAPAPAAPGLAAPGSASTLSAEVRQRLVGRWLRPDGGYVLTIQNVGDDGKVAATYANPRLINVAKAQATNEGGKLALYVELRDRGYPGSFYTLSYDAGRDQFTGVYHHLGLNQTFEVNFERLGKEASGRE
jgi:hypothetical protein